MRCIKTELYFGESEPGGKSVGLKAWRTFLNQEVTPRFPRGMTVVEGYGQMQPPGGPIARQATRVIVLVHPPSAAVNQHIGAIIASYRAQFANGQVLQLRMPVLGECFAG